MPSVAMNFMSSVFNVVSNHKQSFSISLLTSSIFMILYYSYSGKRKQLKPVKNLTDVIFFTDDSSYRNSNQRNASGVENLKRLTDYLDSAKVSLDVCVFTITSHKLSEVILKKFRDGVKVRIITDNSMAYGDGSQIPKFRREGIMVRVRRSEYLMHHKFAIVDDKLLINGSFNWTEQATFGNWENVAVTTNPIKMVKSYVDHFESIWTILNADHNHK